MHEIKLIVETDDVGEVERLSEAVCALACPVQDERLTGDHACRLPWFVITSTMPTKHAERFRDTLNR